MKSEEGDYRQNAYAPVAQLDRALAFGARRCRFNSCQAHENLRVSPMKKRLLLLFFLILGGCATGNIKQEPVIERGQVVEVIIKPAGARIEMNGKPLGIAPGKFSVIRRPNRYGFLPRMTITALPLEGAKGQYVQTQVFDGYTSTPEAIYFDMSLPPPLPKIEGD
jgi:hypothetical protein